MASYSFNGRWKSAGLRQRLISMAFRAHFIWMSGLYIISPLRNQWWISYGFYGHYPRSWLLKVRCFSPCFASPASCRQTESLRSRHVSFECHPRNKIRNHFSLINECRMILGEMWHFFNGCIPPDKNVFLW